MTVANAVTLSRIALIPVFMWMLYLETPGAKVIAFTVFAMASLTDGVDGYLARRMNQVTNFGKFMDPLADKLLVAAAMLMFVENGKMSAVAVMIILSREFLVTSLRMVGASEGKVIAAGLSGKVKTFTQIICIMLLLTDLSSHPLFGITLGDVAVWLMVAVTVVSGIDYIIRHRELLGLRRRDDGHTPGH